MRVVLADSFWEDFVIIADYLVKNDFDLSLLAEIRDLIMFRLGQFPSSGKIYRDDIRTIVVRRKNVVYYRVVDNKIQVLHLKSGFQDKRIEK